MITINLRVQGRNSTYKSERVSRTEALCDLLKTIKTLFGKVRFRIVDIQGDNEKLKVEQKSYLERLNEVKMMKLRWK